jgi:hypothetical protein
MNILKEKGFSNETEYYNSPEYEKDYDKIPVAFRSTELPIPLAGVIYYKELKNFLKSGDILFVKQVTCSVRMNQTTLSLDVRQNPGYSIIKGGEVLKVNIKNVKVRSTGEYMGKSWDHEISIPIATIFAIIRDGKRYNVDHSTESV